MRLGELLFGRPLRSDEEHLERVGVLTAIPVSGWTRSRRLRTARKPRSPCSFPSEPRRRSGSVRSRSASSPCSSQVVGAVTGRGWFYYLTMGAVFSVLTLSANTSFADFPRVCRLLALDEYLPPGLAHRGRRLVYSHGIVTLAMIAAGLSIAFGGITDRLIPLFAVGPSSPSRSRSSGWCSTGDARGVRGRLGRC